MAEYRQVGVRKFQEFDVGQNTKKRFANRKENRRDCRRYDPAGKAAGNRKKNGIENERLLGKCYQSDRYNRTEDADESTGNGNGLPVAIAANAIGRGRGRNNGIDDEINAFRCQQAGKDRREYTRKKGGPPIASNAIKGKKPDGRTTNSGRSLGLSRSGGRKFRKTEKDCHQCGLDQYDKTEQSEGLLFRKGKPWDYSSVFDEFPGYPEQGGYQCKESEEAIHLPRLTAIRPYRCNLRNNGFVFNEGARVNYLLPAFETLRRSPLPAAAASCLSVAELS